MDCLDCCYSGTFFFGPHEVGYFDLFFTLYRKIFDERLICNKKCVT